MAGLMRLQEMACGFEGSKGSDNEQLVTFLYMSIV